MRQKLGQHFLKNKAALHAIAEALQIEAGDIVMEIGPGHGELTRELLGFGPDKLIAFERDPDFIQEIGKIDPRVEVRGGNALDLLADAAEEHENYKLAGNIPYYISGHLFRTIGELTHKPSRAVFVIQKEVAERMVAEPPRMNRLAASVQVWGRPKILFLLKAGEFSPPPEVDSAAILLVPHGETAPLNLDLVLKSAFSQPRKTLLNNLRSIYKEGDLAERLRHIGLDPEVRPQNLSIEDIHKIAQLLS
jgi:16S rRNA (adenine1518-N6/adenine1519-N6)-dimethyltransferase